MEQNLHMSIVASCLLKIELQIAEKKCGVFSDDILVLIFSFNLFPIQLKITLWKEYYKSTLPFVKYLFLFVHTVDCGQKGGEKLSLICEACTRQPKKKFYRQPNYKEIILLEGKDKQKWTKIPKHHGRFY